MRIIGLLVSIALLTLMGCSKSAKSPEDVVNALAEAYSEAADGEKAKSVFDKAGHVLMTEEQAKASFECTSYRQFVVPKEKGIEAEEEMISRGGVYEFSNVKVVDTNILGSKKAGEEFPYNCKALKDAEFAVVSVSFTVSVGEKSQDATEKFPVTKVDGAWYFGGPRSLATPTMGTRSVGPGSPDQGLLDAIEEAIPQQLK